MVTSPGKSCMVYDSAVASTAFTTEAMTDLGAHTEYKITNEAKRGWNEANGVTVYVDGVEVTSGFSVQYAGGRVIFDEALDAEEVVTVTGKYHAYVKYGRSRGGATDWDIDIGFDEPDGTVMGDTAGATDEGIQRVSANVKGVKADNSLHAKLGELIYVVLHEGGTYSDASSTGPRFEFFARMKSSKQSAKITDSMRQDFAFTAQGQAYWRST